MRRRILIVASFLILAFFARAQNNEQNVFTIDIDNFWNAFDSIRTTKDSAQQLKFIQSMYIDKGTQGLRAFMQARDYSAVKWVKSINRSPKFWASIRPNTLTVKDKAQQIESSINKFKELYPELTDAKMYFTVGGLNSGGTTMGRMILIGSEIATGNAATDVSDLPEGTSKWLGSVFKDQSLDNIIPLNIHEYVHTQQKGLPKYLLGLALREGSCDFITELVIGTPMQNNYIQYGRIHENELRGKFKNEMFTTYYGNWLYNGSKAETVGDLGYFMGYTICKAYYSQATNKKQAIKEIIELNYADSNAIENFLTNSKYYPEAFDKKALRENFELKRPTVVSIEPLMKDDSTISSSVKEMSIVFSQPMSSAGYSFNWGPKGKSAYPLAGVVGFSEDKKSFTIKLDMQPAHDYEFVITDASFRSAEGFPLSTYVARFRTK